MTSLGGPARNEPPWGCMHGARVGIYPRLSHAGTACEGRVTLITRERHGSTVGLVLGALDNLMGGDFEQPP